MNRGPDAIATEDLAELQQMFERDLPRLQRVARFRLRHLLEEKREDEVAEVVALCWQAYRRLFLAGRAIAPLVQKIAEFAARQVNCGRGFTNVNPVRDTLSSTCRHRHGYLVAAIPLTEDEDADPDVVDALSDRHSPANEAILRIDFEAWLETLDSVQRQVALELASGLNTTEVARKHGVSRTRIWQRRKALGASWPWEAP